MVLVRVVIVDDSDPARWALRRSFADDPSLAVVGEACDGEQARDLVLTLRPDLVTMDIYLRSEDGLAVTASLMARAPVPILIVTSANPRDPDVVYRAMEAGALDVCGKPLPRQHPDFELHRRRLVRLVKALAKVPVARRRHRPATSSMTASPASVASAPPEVVLLGASTGGPPTLARILRLLPRPFGLPIVLVQHIAEGFGEGFAKWLGATTGHDVRIVTQQAPLYQRPSVDVLFESAARHLGPRSLAALLTGMGSDGALGLVSLLEQGTFTLAQDPSTCAVPSMPQSAISAGAASVVASPEDIAAHLARATPAV